MNLKCLLCFALSIALMACTSMQWPEETFGSPGGYVKTMQVVPRLDICSPDGYINGYRFGYMTAWNEEITKKVDTYASVVKQNPQDASAQASYRFYQAKLFKLDNINQRENRFDYVPPSVTCESDSYAMGRGHGIKDATRDVDALRPTEPQRPVN